MLITLFTDAGFCPQTKVASYAVWAKCNGGCFRKSGILKGRLPDATIAELRAMINGLYCIRAFFQPEPGSKVIAQTDCLTAIHALQGKAFEKPRNRFRVKKERATIHEVVGSAFSVEYRHVTGHRGHEDKRSSVNTWCDSECRKFLKQARALVTKGPV